MAINLVEDITNNITLECNVASSSNKNIMWIKSFDKINIFPMEQKSDSNKTQIALNGKFLTLNDLSLLDQQYYGCYFATNETELNSLSLISVYYLTVRSKIF